MPPATEPENRYHALDAVRAFALLLGVVFHASESFGPNAFRYWAAVDNSSSELLETFRHASHSFRLELFFLIAGFFAHLVWKRKGVSGFVRNRFGRIVVPLVVGWCILYPVLVFTWLTGVAESGRWEMLAIPEQFRSYPPWQLTLGFFVSLEFLRGFDLTHLWFLYQLLVLYGLALVVRWAYLRSTWLKQVLLPWLDARFRAIVSSSVKVIWFGALVVPALYLQHGWSVDTPKGSLIPELPATFLFSVFFGVGWALHRQPDLLNQVGRHWQGHLLLGLVLVLPSRLFLEIAQQLGWLDRYHPWVRLGHCVLFSLMMWSFVFGFLGVFLRYRKIESRAWRYIADSSYWIYIIHLPLIVWLQLWVASWPLSWVLKFPFIQAVAFPLLFLSYHYLVRSTFIGQQLNGRRYPFQPMIRGAERPSAPADLAGSN